MKKSGGRNNDGRMTMRYRVVGIKDIELLILKGTNMILMPAKSIEYDPNRSAFIALVGMMTRKKDI